jgi:hypothetical protein
MRLITLGDSTATGFNSWAGITASKINYEHVNFSEAAGCNELQIKLMQEWLLDNDLNNNDIVIWQISKYLNSLVRLSMNHHEECEKISNRLKGNSVSTHYILSSKNKFDDEHRIDLLSISPMLRKFPQKIKDDTEQLLQDLLFMFIIIRNIHPKILIFRTHDSGVPKKYWNTMTNIFLERDINFLKETIINYCIDNNLPFNPDGYHPTTESHIQFSEKVVLPKLQSLNWI